MLSFVGFLISVTCVLLILIILVQRGRGGGLAGALGGMGGQSAFGAKAGDLFTKITVVVATVWIVLCVVAVKLAQTSEDKLNIGTEPAAGTSVQATTPESRSATGEGGEGNGASLPATSTEPESGGEEEPAQ